MRIKVYKQKFSVITKDFNYKILTKNLLTLQDGMGLRMENYEGSLKNLIFRGRDSQKPIYWGNCLKRGLQQLAGLYRRLGKKQTPMHQCTLCSRMLFYDTVFKKIHYLSYVYGLSYDVRGKSMKKVNNKKASPAFRFSQN